MKCVTRQLFYFSYVKTEEQRQEISKYYKQKAEEKKLEDEKKMKQKKAKIADLKQNFKKEWKVVSFCSFMMERELKTW